MHQDDKQRILELRQDCISKYGTSPSGVEWSPKCPSRQSLCFEIIRQTEGFLQAGSVLDVGCGFGDLAAFLKRAGWNGSYTGIDFSEETVRAGRAKNPGVDLRVADLLADPLGATFDFVVCSGALNYKLASSDNYTYLAAMLSKMYELSTKGVSINLLSPYVDYTQEGSFHPDMDRLLRIVSSISKRFTLRHDFMPHIQAVYIYHDTDFDPRRCVFPYGEAIIRDLGLE